MQALSKANNYVLNTIGSITALCVLKKLYAYIYW